MHDDGYFDEAVAARYDQDTAIFAPEVVDPVVDFLVDLAGKGRALELGIGTGRIAVPLARRGVPVHGIDISLAMLARIEGKPGAENIEVTVGDFSATRVPGSFAVAYLVFNTINNLTSQEAQVACFRNVADHLDPGGTFVIEVGVPALRSLAPGQTNLVFHFSEDRWGIDEYHPATQEFWSHHFKAEGTELRRMSVPFRYTWPSELDLMAQMAGMRLRERWENWDRSPFTDESTRHVSVWEKPG